MLRSRSLSFFPSRSRVSTTSDSPARGALVRDALIAVVQRAGETIPPRGSTVVRAGDRLFVLVARKSRPDLEDVFTRWQRRV